MCLSRGSIEMGASIMHAGVCLTVVDFGAQGEGSWFAVEAVPETLSLTVLGDWVEGSEVNLEQSLKLGQELGGHFVFGHVDGVGEVVSSRTRRAELRITIRPPADIAKYFAKKGSTAINGVSLTVAEALAEWRLPGRDHSAHLGGHDTAGIAARIPR